MRVSVFMLLRLFCARVVCYCYEAVCVGAAERECGMLDRLYAEVCAGRNG